MNTKIIQSINDYGLKLQKDFIIKAKIQEDYDKGIFDGTWKYEDKIETIEDAIGWMLETYDLNAYDVIDGWISVDKADKVWGLDIYVLQQELEKTLDIKTVTNNKAKYIIKAFEEELGTDLFVVTVPEGIDEKEVYKNFEMAKKYSSWFIDENPDEYDKHFEAMAHFRENSNGMYTFNYYLQEFCGYDVEELKFDFEYEW